MCVKQYKDMEILYEKRYFTREKWAWKKELTEITHQKGTYSKVLDMSNLSDDELVSEIIIGYEDVKLGNTRCAKEVFADIRGEWL